MHDAAFTKEVSIQLSKYGVGPGAYSVARKGPGRLLVVRVLLNGRTLEIPFPRRFAVTDVQRIIKNKMGG